MIVMMVSPPRKPHKMAAAAADTRRLAALSRHIGQLYGQLRRVHTGGTSKHPSAAAAAVGALSASTRVRCSGHDLRTCAALHSALVAFAGTTTTLAGWRTCMRRSKWGSGTPPAFIRHCPLSQVCPLPGTHARAYRYPSRCSTGLRTCSRVGVKCPHIGGRQGGGR